MTSLDPSHLPSRHNRPSRGQAVQYERRNNLTLPIPDLRFEQSYLRSLRRYVHFGDGDPAIAAFADEKKVVEMDSQRKKDLAVSTGMAEGPYGLLLKIDWTWVFYITARDQILSPFIQGAALAAATAYLRPFLRGIGARVRYHVVKTWQDAFPPLTPHVQSSAQWVGKQIKDIGITGVSTNIALAK